MHRQILSSLSPPHHQLVERLEGSHLHTHDSPTVATLFSYLFIDIPICKAGNSTTTRSRCSHNRKSRRGFVQQLQWRLDRFFAPRCYDRLYVKNFIISCTTYTYTTMCNVSTNWSSSGTYTMLYEKAMILTVLKYKNKH